MNSMKYSIAKLILTVIILLGQLMTSDTSETNSVIPCISEIPSPQPFFKLSFTELSFIP